MNNTKKGKSTHMTIGCARCLRYRLGSFRPARVCRVAAGLALAVAYASSPAPAAAQQAQQPKPATRPAFSLGFKPQANDASAKRVGGISRAHKTDPTYVSVLAPGDVVGKTTKDQPALYWYLSGPTDKPILVSLQPLGKDGKETKNGNILETTIKGHKDAGLHRLDLATVKDDDSGKPVKLDPDTQYAWVVEIQSQQKEGSGNSKASCRLHRVPAPADVQALEKSNPAEAAQRYAAAGIWYDAIASLNAAIDASKNDPATADSLRQARRELLKSQGLIEDESGRIEEPSAAAGTPGGK